MFRKISLRLNYKFNQRIDKLLSYPGCDVKTLNTRKTLWLASLIGFIFVLPNTIYTTILYSNASFSLYYNYYIIVVLSILLIITPFLIKYYNLVVMIELVIRQIISFYFLLKLGGIPYAYGMLFVSLAYVFITIPLRVIWFTMWYFVLFTVLTIIVAYLGPTLKAPDEKMLDYSLKAVFSVINIIFMSALALYFVVSFMKKQQDLEVMEAKKQKELNEAKTRLFTNITHEFRTPLTVIRGMTDLIDKQPELWIPEGTHKIRKNSDLILRLVNQMLDISRIEAKAMPVHMVKGDITRYIAFIIDLHRSAAIEKNISLKFTGNEKPLIMDFDPDIFSQILSNLLGNAIKFTPENGVVEIKTGAEEAEALFTLQVSDSGKGIPEDKIRYVFDRFYQVENHANSGGGTGLGLALAKELTTLLNGNISVESKPGKGSVFNVQLPVTRVAETGEHILKSWYKKEVIQPYEKKNSAFKENGSNNGELPILLIVEDIKDVSLYLSAILENEYQVELATNGKTGLEKAIEHVPDIIISDVMMPEMDGIEMLNRLKTDFRTSHIPVVILTAKADIDSRLEGLERGADAYITKPFNETELLIQLRNLIELRKKLHERYASMAGFSASKDPTLKTEDAFVLKLREILEKNIDNDEYNIKDICREMAVGHTQLYRKFKSISNLTVADYLKMLRLNRAKELLTNPELNITQVAFAVGFKNLSHFSREFALQFGKSPKETRKKVV